MPTFHTVIIFCLADCIFDFLSLCLQVLQSSHSVEDETKYIELMVINDHLMVRYQTLTSDLAESTYKTYKTCKQLKAKIYKALRNTQLQRLALIKKKSGPRTNPCGTCEVNLYSVLYFLQYKKHRLSVGQTNNYAKSVVNMADFVSMKLCFYIM